MDEVTKSREISIRKASHMAVAMVFLLFFISLVYFVYERVVIENKRYYRIEHDYLKYLHLTNGSIDYAFFGDSHTNNGINPEFIPGAYNFAVGGQNYIKIYHRLNKIINTDGAKIDTVVFGIDPHSFSSKFYEESFLLDDLWYWHRDFRFFSIEEISGLSGRSKIYILLSAHLPFVGNGRDFEVLFKEDVTEIYMGWVADTRQFDKEDKNLVAIRDYNANFKGQNSQMIGVGINYFNKTINLAKDNNLTIIFIKYPLSKEYHSLLDRNELSQEEYYLRLFSMINESLEAYHLLDYQTIYFENDEYFADSAHLNPEGAQAFSKMVYGDLISLKRANSLRMPES